ncbi:MAG: hypothetical protein AMXMBFR53_32860 [Gemmatimonadota bacterium]
MNASPTPTPAHVLVSLLLVGTLAWGCGGEPVGPPAPETPVVASVEVTLPVGQLTYGGSTQAIARVLDRSRVALPGHTPTWSSSNTAVATVGADGMVQAVGSGLTTIQASVGSVTGGAELEVVPAEVPLKSTAEQVMPFQFFEVTPPPDRPFPPEGVAAAVGAVAFHFVTGEDGLARAILPDLSPGPVRILMTLDPNHVGVLSLTVVPPPPVQDPAAVVSQFQAELGAALDASPPEGDDQAAVLEFARAGVQAFRAWSDTASDESKRQVAVFLAANPQLRELAGLGPPGGMAKGGPQLGLLPRCDAQDVQELRLEWCQGVAAGYITVFVSGLLAVSTTCVAPFSPLCFASAAAILLGGSEAYRAGVRLRTITGSIVDVLDVHFDGTSERSDAALASGAGTDEVTFVHDGRYRAEMLGSYRSVVAADASGGGLLAKTVGTLSAIREGWLRLEDWWNGMPSLIRSGRPPLPAAPPAAPEQPAATAQRRVPAKYLTVAGVSQGTRATYDPETGVLVASLAPGSQGPEASISFDLRYSSPTGELTRTVSGTVRSPFVMSASAGNNQQARPGTAVAQPLVVGIVNSVHGSPVPGATVRWTVKEGGGSVQGATTTDAEGLATAQWTLGIPPRQVLEATATVQGIPVFGSPVTFKAVADTVRRPRPTSGGSW